MSDIDFKPVFDHIDQSLTAQRDSILSEVKVLIHEEIGDLKVSVANLSSQVKQYHEEMLVSGHRVDRLEQWARQVGDKVGVPIVF